MQHLFAEVVKMNYKYEIVNYDKNIPACRDAALRPGGQRHRRPGALS